MICSGWWTAMDSRYVCDPRPRPRTDFLHRLISKIIYASARRTTRSPTGHLTPSLPWSHSTTLSAEDPRSLRRFSAARPRRRKKWIPWSWTRRCCPWTQWVGSGVRYGLPLYHVMHHYNRLIKHSAAVAFVLLEVIRRARFRIPAEEHQGQGSGSSTVLECTRENEQKESAWSRWRLRSAPGKSLNIGTILLPRRWSL